MPLSSRNEDGQVVDAKNRYTSAQAVVSTFSDDHPSVMEECDLFLQVLQEVPIEQSERILEALEFAARRHAHETRKDPGQTPYIVHPIAVAHALITIGHILDSDTLVAALLHDTVEDTPTTFEELRQLFGPKVESLVRELSDDKSLPKQERKRRQVLEAPEKSLEAAQIKLADKLCNLRDLAEDPPPNWSPQRVDAYFSWAADVVNALPPASLPLKAAIDQLLDAHRI